MEATIRFKPFAYLLEGADDLLRTGREYPPGSGYCRNAAVVFAAFTIEACLNHIGERICESWDNPKLKWKAKLETVTKKLGIEYDSKKPPFTAIDELLEFRDKLAHGRTEAFEASHQHSGNREDEFTVLDPPWLKKYQSNEAVQQVLADTRQIVELFHEKAELPKETIGEIASGMPWEAQGVVGPADGTSADR
jgi:hypothetical protein